MTAKCRIEKNSYKTKLPKISIWYANFMLYKYSSYSFSSGFSLYKNINSHMYEHIILMHINFNVSEYNNVFMDISYLTRTLPLPLFLLHLSISSHRIIAGMLRSIGDEWAAAGSREYKTTCRTDRCYCRHLANGNMGSSQWRYLQAAFVQENGRLLLTVQL